ncbi:hypothetical protein J6590_031635 [Homalodisca vitripennis]|nr:hypothetical protein J6590_031635 [Homalodisca vitripennis]
MGGGLVPNLTHSVLLGLSEHKKYGPPRPIPSSHGVGEVSDTKLQNRVGRRTSEFSTVERATRESVMMRRDLAAAAALASPPTTHANGHAQRHSTSGDVSTGMPGKYTVSSRL